MIFPDILDPFEGAGGRHRVAPIGAQPVVELFARIPLYILMADAEDRTIARRAFEGLLPEPLLSRKVKCYVEGHSTAVVQHHREFITNMLAGGIPAQCGFIDNAAAEAGIQSVGWDNSSPVSGIPGPQLNIETWLRYLYARWGLAPEPGGRGSGDGVRRRGRAGRQRDRGSVAGRPRRQLALRRPARVFQQGLCARYRARDPRYELRDAQPDSQPGSALNPRVQFTAYYQRNDANDRETWNTRLAWEYRPLSFPYLVYNRNDALKSIFYQWVMSAKTFMSRKCRTTPSH